MAQWQIDNPKKSGLSLSELFELANDKMLVSTQKQLKEAITEFIDHKIINKKEASTGVIKMKISCSQDILRRIATNQLI